MKKLLYFVIAVLITGCGAADMSNTPTKQVEVFLNRYQSLDAAVMNDLDRVIAEEENFNSAHRERYRNIMKGHYQDLTYNVKNEEVNGDSAIVTVEIEVRDYSKAIDTADQYLENNPDEFSNEIGEHDAEKFVNYKLDLLEDSKEKVKYTLNISLNKVDGKWKVNQLSQTDLDKINGMYRY